MRLPGTGPEAISPTAHYTGHVWARHGLSHPALDTLEGRVLHTALEPVAALSGLLGGPTLDGMLLARHRVIDAALEEAIDAGRVTQIVEIAAGMSPRGLRFADRVAYVEADLPAMAARKRRALARAGARHRVVDLDALADDGPLSLAALAGELDPRGGLAIVAEGLFNYFDRAAVTGMWTRIAATLRRFPHGLHVADLLLQDAMQGMVPRAFTLALQAFVRGRVHVHFADDDEAAAALRAAGFATATVARAATHPAATDLAGDPGTRLVRVLTATTG